MLSFSVGHKRLHQSQQYAHIKIEFWLLGEERTIQVEASGSFEEANLLGNYKSQIIMEDAFFL